MHSGSSFSCALTVMRSAPVSSVAAFQLFESRSGYNYGSRSLLSICTASLRWAIEPALYDLDIPLNNLIGTESEIDSKGKLTTVTSPPNSGKERKESLKLKTLSVRFSSGKEGKVKVKERKDHSIESEASVT